MLFRFAPAWIGVLSLAVASKASAAAPSELVQRAESTVAQVQAIVPKLAHQSRKVSTLRMTPAERIAMGELLLHNRDWERAISSFSQVLELAEQGGVSEAARADAQFMMAEAYLKANQPLSAQTQYLQLVARGGRAPYGSYVGRSASRLVDVALRTNQNLGLEQLIANLDRLGGSDRNGEIGYARAKAYFALRDDERAHRALLQIPPTSSFRHQAMYMQGVLLVRQFQRERGTGAVAEARATGETASRAGGETLAAAIEQFRAVTRLPRDTTEHGEVVDLAYMAVGRLFYESDRLLDAAEAYGHVERTSPEFPTMLFELAWVYARLGDYQRAQRALEVLSIAEPKSLDFADDSLLRADLMLRSGQFDKALNLYQSVRGRFDPVTDQVDRFLRSTTDPAVFYDRLVADSLEQQSATDMAPFVVEWAKEEAQNERAFAVVDDVALSRDLVRRSRRLAAKLSGVLSSPARVKAFPKLKSVVESTLGAQNRLFEARLLLARALDSVLGDDVPGALAAVHQRRSVLMARIAQLPMGSDDFIRREGTGEVQWNTLSQRLQQLTLEADTVQAIVNGLSRLLRESAEQGVRLDEVTRERYAREIEANQRDLAGYREQIQACQEAVETGRAQIGLGDSRYVEDAESRVAFRRLLDEELSRLSSADGDVGKVVRESLRVLGKLGKVEASLESLSSSLEREARSQSSSLETAVRRETESVEMAASQLDELDQQARVAVGQVAMENFAKVREKLRKIVLQADIGIVQQGWEVREEQRTRVVELQRERAREEQNLNDELREVLDDAEATP